MSDDAQVVRHDIAQSRFVVIADGFEATVRYRVDGAVMQVLSTRVPPPIEGRGIAAALTRAALAFAESNGLTVDPVCSYTAAYLRRKQR